MKKNLNGNLNWAKKILREQDWRISRMGRTIRWVLYEFGFAQCRYCFYFESNKKEKYRKMRDSLALTEGRCGLAKESMSTSYLNSDDLDKVHRCPVFTQVRFNAKGFALNEHAMEDVFRKKKSNRELIFQFLGWFFAFTSVFVTVILFYLTYTQQQTFWEKANRPIPSVSFQPQPLKFEVKNVGSQPLTNLRVRWLIAHLVEDVAIVKEKGKHQKQVLERGEYLRASGEEETTKMLDIDKGVIFMIIKINGAELENPVLRIFYKQASEQDFHETDGSLWALGDDHKQAVKELFKKLPE